MDEIEVQKRNQLKRWKNKFKTKKIRKEQENGTLSQTLSKTLSYPNLILILFYQVLQGGPLITF